MGEPKLFYTVLATLFVYGLSSFLQFGVFILPLPFYEISLFLIAGYLSWKSLPSSKILSVFLMLFGLLNFLSVDYNYAFFLDDQKLEELSNSSILDLVKLTKQITLVCLFYFQTQLKPLFTKNLFHYALLIPLFSAMAIPSPFFSLSIYTIIGILLIFKNKHFENTYSLWLHLFLFLLSREVSLNFF